MDRIRQGWELTKKSWALLRENKQLLRFPVAGALTALLLLVVFAGPGMYLVEEGPEIVGALLVALGVYGAVLAGTFFSVGLAATADAIFHERPASFGDGLAVARANIGAVAGWAAISALIGVIISALQRGGSVGETIAAAVVGTAWSLVTFMAIPVLAFEGTGPWQTLKRSAGLFRERWVGQVTGNVAIGGVVLLAIVPAIALIAGGGYLWADEAAGGGIAAGVALVAAGVFIFAVSMLIWQAMRSIFGVALYRFATTGSAPATFTEAELQSAVRTK